MARRETNFDEWNTEARAFVACGLACFITPCVVEIWFPRAAALIFCPSLAVVSFWGLTYLWRAGEYRRRMIAFHQVWGSRCRICHAPPGEPCDAGLHG